MLINCRGVILDTSIPKIMGVLNMTPDSFFDGNKYTKTQHFKKQIDKMISEGADIIDVGGMSSRPGAEVISEKEEWDRIKEALQYLKTNYPDQLISVDTIHSEVASKSLDLGVQIINDISGGVYNEEMITTVAQAKAAYVIMHMISDPSQMQNHTHYEKGLVIEIMAYFKSRISAARNQGLHEIILDLGFGFSKTLEQNYELMNMMHTFKIFSCPILTGISRKSMVYKLLGSSPKESLNGSSALHMKALLEGSSILRVHDVKEAKEVVMIYNALSKANS